MKIDLKLKKVKYLGNKMYVPKWVRQIVTDENGEINGWSEHAELFQDDVGIWRVTEESPLNNLIYTVTLGKVSDDDGDGIVCREWRETLREV